MIEVLIRVVLYFYKRSRKRLKVMLLRLLSILLFCLLCDLQYNLWFSSESVRHVWLLESSNKQLVRDNQKIAKRNALVLSDVQDLKTGRSALEEHARYDLGLVKPGEIYYRIVASKKRRRNDIENTGIK